MPSSEGLSGHDRGGVDILEMRIFVTASSGVQSLDDQRSALQQYAQEHGLHILRWYTDDAISGAQSASRKAFQAMIADAQKEGCLFSTIVVYDIKRFGRIDNDEAGHYRWILRQHGVRVAYVAEHFVGDTLDDLIRPVKQWQAREESRDLSRVTIRGLLSKVHRDLPRGAWLNGSPLSTPRSNNILNSISQFLEVVAVEMHCIHVRNNILDQLHVLTGTILHQDV